MQKKLIALAVAGLAAAPAFAQTNVTIYGIADATFDVVRTSNPGNSQDTLGSTTRVSSNSSYLGFKGTEDLGNGLKALFQYESQLDFTGGNNFQGTRDSFVGLSSDNYGTVVLGTLTGPTRALATTLDVNSGAAGIGANSAILGKMGGMTVGTIDSNSNFVGNPGNSANNTPAGNGNTACSRSQSCQSIFDTRWRNAIAYVSPTYYGLNLTAAYVANENKSFDGAQAKVNTRGYDLGLKYTNGPVLAGVTYNYVNVGNHGFATGNSNLGDNVRVDTIRVGGMYDFGVATVRLLGERAAVRSDAGNFHQFAWGVGATYNVLANTKLIAQYYNALDVQGDTVNAPANSPNARIHDKTGASLAEIGVEHSLSKRTMIKASYTYLQNGRNANYDFGNNAAGVATSNATGSGIGAANGAGGYGSALYGFSVGVRHAF